MDDSNKDFLAARIAMIDDQLRARDITSRRVLDAMLAVPRHLFVAPDIADRAYEDSALPTSDGQTISQPYIVAFMTQHLDIEADHTILELGTGSGYQTAILAHLAPRGHIYTIERSASLSDAAKKRFDTLHITNIHHHTGDGSLGWPAPQSKIENQKSKITFDRILITAAAPQVPQPLLDQLKPGGLLLAPIGPAETQNLTLFHKSSTPPHTLTQSPLLQCRFVPLLGKHAFPDLTPPPCP